MRMTLLGTGVRTPFVLHGLADRERELGLTEVVLHDADPARLDIMEALGADLCRSWGAGFAIRSERDLGGALAGSRFVFSAIRVGQEEARALDEELPLKYGVLGQETTGPGGFAMALRTIPAVLDIARMIEQVAPDALLVNFTNPVSIVMQALHDHTAVRAVGICDGPVSMKRSVAELLGAPGNELRVDYFGLNHCGWIHRVQTGGRDRLPEVLDRYEELQGIDKSWRLFEPGFVRSLGMLPMEYLYFYYSREQAVDHIVRSGSTRGRQIASLNAALWPELSERIGAGDLPGARASWERVMDARDETYFARERGEDVPDRVDERAADRAEMFEGEGYEGMATAVMQTAAQRRSSSLILNTANRGAIHGLRDDDVVEVSCLMDEHGPQPLAQGAIPDAARLLLQQVKAYERLTVRAAVEGSYDAALEALLAHPLVGSHPLARSILDDYLSMHGASLAHIAR